MTEFDSLILTGPELGHSVDSYCDELGETILASMAFKRLRTSNREVKRKNSDCKDLMLNTVDETQSEVSDLK